VADRAIFLDRDGVINVDHGYTHRIADFRFIDGSAEALALLQSAGWRLVVVTNQSGIARGLYSSDAYERFTAHLRAQLQASGVHLDAVLHCPHLPDAAVAAYRLACDCRKPAPGMLLRAARDAQDVVTRTLPGAQVRAFQDLELSEPELRLIPDDRRISESGWTRAQVATIVRAVGDGIWVGEHFDGERHCQLHHPVDGHTRARRHDHRVGPFPGTNHRLPVGQEKWCSTKMRSSGSRADAGLFLSSRK